MLGCNSLTSVFHANTGSGEWGVGREKKGGGLGSGKWEVGSEKVFDGDWTSFRAQGVELHPSADP